MKSKARGKKGRSKILQASKTGRRKSPKSTLKKPSLKPLSAAITLRKSAVRETFPPSSHPTSLPFSYNETKLVLLVRDPYWVYSYWDFSGETWDWIENLRRGEPNCRALLRIYNKDNGSHSDIEVDLVGKNWYLHLGLPDTNFEVELGLLDPEGKFHVIARSNPIRTPRDGPSKVVDPKWDPGDFDEIYRLSGGGKTGHGSELFSRIRKP